MPRRSQRITPADSNATDSPAGLARSSTHAPRRCSTLDGLRGGYLEDSAFAAVAARDRRDGRHRNPTGDPAYFTTAYFHRPEDLAADASWRERAPAHRGAAGLSEHRPT